MIEATTTHLLSPSRLTVARRRHGLDPAGLARRLDLPVDQVTDLERTGRTDSSVLDRLVDVLGYPPGFYRLPPPDDVHRPSVELHPATDPLHAELVALAAMAGTLADWLDANVDSDPVGFPPGLVGAPPDRAADLLRQRFELGDDPAPSLVHLAELLGVRVFSTAVPSTASSSFSCHLGDQPLILLPVDLPPAHRRWRTGHELGNLIAGLGPRTVPDPEYADRFARRLLLPEPGLRRHRASLAGSSANVGSGAGAVASLAATFRTPVEPLVEVLTELDLLPPRAERPAPHRTHPRHPCQTAPSPVGELSPTLTAVLEQLRQDGRGQRHLADELQLRAADVAELLHGLVPTVALPSAGTPDRSTPPSANLRLVVR